MKRKNDGTCLCLCKRKEVWAFWFMVIVSTLTTWYVTGNLLDSDASSEMVLAQHWIQSKSVLSSDWLYGSELRLLHMQLIFAPLMLMIEDWELVRFLGTLIMHGIYLSAFNFMICRAGFRKEMFYWGGALLLLPVSVCYGRIVLYHCHYLPNITLSFFLVGLCLGFSREINWKKVKPWRDLVLLACFSFLGGLNSIRQLMITHVPLLVCIGVFCLQEETENDAENNVPALLRKEYHSLWLTAIGAACCSVLGFFVNSRITSSGVTVAASFNGNELSLLNFSQLHEVFYSYIIQFGFRNWTRLLSVSGVFSLGGLFVSIYVCVITIRRVLGHTHAQDIRQSIPASFFLFYTGIMLCLFVFMGGGNDYSYSLYLSLCYPWLVPAFLLTLQEVPRQLHPLHRKRLFTWLCSLFLVLNGFANISWYWGGDYFPQAYEGLSFQDVDKKGKLTAVADYLEENGYDLGYATHWECNILTEITDGRIPMVNLSVNDENGLAYFNCLTSLWNRERPSQRQFLLLPNSEQTRFTSSDSMQCYCLVYQDADHCVYEILDRQHFSETLFS